MNCSDVRRQLDERRPADHAPSERSAELQAHLDSCPDCAAEARRVIMLQRLFQEASADDTVDLKSTEAHRMGVAARESQRMAGYRGQRQLVALGTVTAAALILITFLAPWNVPERADGYKLSVDGVRVELAANEDRLCDMLFALGAVNAGVDVGECDTTCQIVIFDLRTRDEARLVEDAIRRMHPEGVTVDLIPVKYQSAEG